MHFLALLACAPLAERARLFARALLGIAGAAARVILACKQGANEKPVRFFVFEGFLVIGLSRFILDAAVQVNQKVVDVVGGAVWKLALVHLLDASDLGTFLIRERRREHPGSDGVSLVRYPFTFHESFVLFVKIIDFIV